MNIAKDLEERMTSEEFFQWQTGDIQNKTEIALRYLQGGENVILNRLGENMISDELNANLKYVKGVLTEGFRAALYPPSQKASQYKRLILTRNSR